MERSKLEQLQDKAIFLLIKKISEGHGFDLGDNSFTNDCDTYAKLFGLGRLDYIDYNYIVATYNLNVPSTWEQSRLVGELNRPVAKNYEYRYYETRNETVTTTYELEQSSYDKNLVRETIRMAEDDGNLEWWNGREIDRDYGDGDTVDSGFVRGSIEEA
jgi:hypothetical protein